MFTRAAALLFVAGNRSEAGCPYHSRVDPTRLRRSLYDLRDGEVPQAMSRLGSNKRGQVLRIWTGPKLEGADDRLPLLTPNEKQRRVALRESPAASSTLGLGTTEDRPSRSGSNSSIELRDQRMDLLR